MNRLVDTTNCFAAGSARFRVRSPDPPILDVVEKLLVDLSTADDDTAAIDVALEPAGDGMFALHVEGDEPHLAQHPDMVVSLLITAITRMALDAEPESLHLHSAALSRDGRGVLIPAQSGSGKSTLTAALLERGWAYTSDESVAVGADGRACRGFPKPLTLKPGHHDPLPDLGRLAVVTSETHAWRSVPASSITANIAATVTPDVILVLQPPVDGDFDRAPSVSPAHPADVVVRMMNETMDAQRFGPRAVEVLARLAAGARCFALAPGHIEETCTIVDELVALGPIGRSLDVLEAVGEPAATWSVAPDVRAVTIDGRVVAHDTDSGAIVALDEAGSAVWLCLYGRAPEWWHDRELTDPTSIAFLDQLSTHGLVRPSVGDGR